MYLLFSTSEATLTLYYQIQFTTRTLLTLFFLRSSTSFHAVSLCVSYSGIYIFYSGFSILTDFVYVVVYKNSSYIPYGGDIYICTLYLYVFISCGLLFFLSPFLIQLFCLWLRPEAEMESVEHGLH